MIDVHVRNNVIVLEPHPPARALLLTPAAARQAINALTSAIELAENMDSHTERTHSRDR